MRSLKKILFSLLVAVTSVFLVACKETYYSLQLPENVTANIENPFKILKDNEIILTVNVPENKELDKLLINSIEVLVNDNMFVFNLSEDTIVEVYFKDAKTEINYKLVLPPGVTTKINNLDKIKENTEIILNVNVEENEEVLSFKVNGKEEVLTNFTYTFIINEDTTVELVLKDITGDNYYKITLPDNVTADVSNVNKVKEQTLVLLTLELASNEEFVSFKINGQEHLLTDNKTSFIITQDTIVEVVVKEIENPLDVVYVSFVDELGNALLTTKEVIVGEKITKPKTPYKEGYEFVDWYLNDEVFDFSIAVYEDIVLKGVFKVVEDNILSVLIDLFTNDNLVFIKEGTLKLSVNGFEEDEEFIDTQVYLRFNENVELVEFYLNYLNIEDEDYFEYIKFYADGTYIFLDNNILYEQEPIIMMVPLNQYFIEMFLPIILSEVLPYFDLIGDVNITPYLDFDILDFLIKNNFVEYFEFEKDDDQTIISLAFDNELFIEFLKGTEFKDYVDYIDISEFTGKLEVVFVDYQVVAINIELFDVKDNIYYEMNISYVDEEIEVPDEILNIDETEFEFNTYYLHLDEDTVITFKLQKDILDLLDYDLDYPIGLYLLPTKTGYESIGLYRDEELKNIITYGDLLEADVHLFVGWKKID